MKKVRIDLRVDKAVAEQLDVLAATYSSTRPKLVMTALLVYLESLVATRAVPAPLKAVRGRPKKVVAPVAPNATAASVEFSRINSNPYWSLDDMARIFGFDLSASVAEIDLEDIKVMGRTTFISRDGIAAVLSFVQRGDDSTKVPALEEWVLNHVD